MVPIISARRLWFRYPEGDWVLRGLSLEVGGGEAVLIIGGTGCGKTTLARVLNGVGVHVYEGVIEGEVLVKGKGVLEYDVGELSRIIHVVGQNPYIYFTEPLLEEDLRSYAESIHGNLERADKSFRKAAESMGLWGVLKRYFFELSGGQARRAVISKALIADPELIVFDEPLMWLDDKGVYEFLNVLRMLKLMGKSVLVFEHRFLPLLNYADRVYVMSEGRLKEVPGEPSRLLGEMRDALPEPPKHPEGSGVARGRVAVEARGVRFSYRGTPVLRGVDLTAGEGEILFIYGDNGSGKSTLLKILAGYLKPKEGNVLRSGRAIYIPQNIYLFFTEECVRNEVREVCRAHSGSEDCVEEGLRRVAELGLDPDKTPFNLSYGQMVKLAITVAQLVPGLSVILLDEPFSGLTYADRVKLLEYLVKVKPAKIIATSNSEVLGLREGVKVLRLEDGVLMEDRQLGDRRIGVFRGG
ncbi:MAG: ABC transporter ATP-binding protein [Zestosphaera sp.]